jgi:hypothetical protein
MRNRKSRITVTGHTCSVCIIFNYQHVRISNYLLEIINNGIKHSNFHVLEKYKCSWNVENKQLWNIVHFGHSECVRHCYRHHIMCTSYSTEEFMAHCFKILHSWLQWLNSCNVRIVSVSTQYDCGNWCVSLKLVFVYRLTRCKCYPDFGPYICVRCLM